MKTSKHNYWITFLFSFLLSISLSAQPNISAIDDYIAQAQKDWNIPGFAVGIIKDGKVVLARGYGNLEQGKNEKVDGNTLFAIASNTKAFISAALAILVEEGKLDWDDPVQKYLPYFELYDDYASTHTTVRDLLCHRAGLGTYSGDVIWYKNQMSAEEVIKKIKYVPQAYDFRAGYGYSNLMFITAGEVIKAVSGKNWDVFIKEKIFLPLGMLRTQTSVKTLKDLANVASPHKPEGDQNQPIPWVNWDNMGAAGGIISSVNDMLKWMQLQIEGGTVQGQRIFSEKSQAEFWHPHNSHKVSKNSNALYRNRHFSAYGLGWGLSDYGGRFVAAHGGGYDGMYSRVCIIPEEKLGIVVLTNTMKGISTPLSYYILDHYLGLEPKDWSKMGQGWEKSGQENRGKRVEERVKNRLEGTSPSLSLEQYTGSFHSDMFGDIEIQNHEGRLKLHFATAPNMDAFLSHWHLNTFEIKWLEPHAWFGFGTIQFMLDNNGKVQGLQFDVPNEDIFFEEIEAVRK